MKFLSLFAGIGGFDLGLERAGHECVGQVEIDPFCRRVLAKHWPNVWRHDDVKTLTKELCDEHCGRIDFICGGFPCQDISFAGNGGGLDRERSGLFFEAMRIVRDIRPQFVVMENVAALLDRGLGRVLAAMAESGFDAEWECLPASAFGAFHHRDRIFICAHRKGSVSGVFSKSRDEWRRQFQLRGLVGHQAVARWPSQRFEGEPDVAVLVDGIPDRVGRYGFGKALGNSIVPQVAEYIGRLLPLTLEAA